MAQDNPKPKASDYEGWTLAQSEIQSMINVSAKFSWPIHKGTNLQMVIVDNRDEYLAKRIKYDGIN